MRQHEQRSAVESADRPGEYKQAEGHKKSSAEAKLVAVSDSCPQVLWRWNFLISQVYFPQAATIHQDNQSAMAFVGK